MINGDGGSVSVGQGEENIRRNAPEESGQIADGGFDPILPEEVEADDDGLLDDDPDDESEKFRKEQEKGIAQVQRESVR